MENSCVLKYCTITHVCPRQKILTHCTAKKKSDETKIKHTLRKHAYSCNKCHFVNVELTIFSHKIMIFVLFLSSFFGGVGAQNIFW